MGVRRAGQRAAEEKLDQPSDTHGAQSALAKLSARRRSGSLFHLSARVALPSVCQATGAASGTRSLAVTPASVGLLLLLLVLSLATSFAFGTVGPPGGRQERTETDNNNQQSRPTRCLVSHRLHSPACVVVWLKKDWRVLDA